MTVYSHGLARRSLATFWNMATVMVPIMILTRLAESYGVIEWMSPGLRPVMALLNLPPEAAIVCLNPTLAGLYGAIATLPVLMDVELIAAQLTSICAILLIAHCSLLTRSRSSRAS
jgi:hypothetical protein